MVADGSSRDPHSVSLSEPDEDNPATLLRWVVEAVAMGSMKTSPFMHLRIIKGYGTVVVVVVVVEVVV